jgi:glycosyltransferase involved in cell wall biosynthesis
MANYEPIVSVSIPCFNYGCYLDECIDSVLVQSFQNFEIIIVDDASNDALTTKVLTSQEAKDSRIRIIRHSFNMGIAAARNTGVRYSRGDYIVSFDADNVMLHEFLTCHLDTLCNSATGFAGFVYGNCEKFGEESRVVNRKPYSFKNLLRKNNIDCCALYRRKHWEELQGYKEVLRDGLEDWEFWINMAKHGYHGVHIDKVLFRYRAHSGMMTRTSFLSDKRHFRDIVARVQSFHPEVSADLVDYGKQESFTRLQ